MQEIAKAAEGIKTGISFDLPRTEYERIEAVNYSTLKLFAKTPAHARQEMLHPLPPSEAMELGTALHMAVLEPVKFEAAYVLAPKFDRRTKEGKAGWAQFEAEHPGRDYLDADEWATCAGMQKAAQAHEIASQLLYGPGKNECTAVWKDAELGVLCKARLDRFTKFWGYSCVIDIKTTVDACKWAFASQSAKMGYYIQCAFYLDGLNALAPMERRFLTVAIEKDPPFCLAIYEMDEAALAFGREQYRKHIKTLLECREKANWPGYAVGVEPLSLPRWLYKPEEPEHVNG